MSAFKSALTEELHRYSLASSPTYRPSCDSYDSDSSYGSVGNSISNSSNSISNSIIHSIEDDYSQFTTREEDRPLKVIAYIRRMTLTTLYSVFSKFAEKHIIMSSAFTEEEARRRAQRRNLRTASFFRAEDMAENLIVVLKDGENLLITRNPIRRINVQREFGRTRVTRSYTHVAFDFKHFFHNILPGQSTLDSVSHKTPVIRHVEDIQNLFYNKKESMDKTAQEEWMLRRMSNFTRWLKKQNKWQLVEKVIVITRDLWWKIRYCQMNYCLALQNWVRNVLLREYWYYLHDNKN